jgi:hypothetical protein
MGRNRTDPAILDARGTFKKNPDRKREAIKVKDPIERPGCIQMSEEVQMAWQEIVSQAPLGVLTRADGMFVWLLARMICETVTDYKNTNGAKLALINKMLGQIGMNPTDRLRLSVPIKTADNKPNRFERFTR